MTTPTHTHTHSWHIHAHMHHSYTHTWHTHTAHSLTYGTLTHDWHTHGTLTQMAHSHTMAHTHTAHSYTHTACSHTRSLQETPTAPQSKAKRCMCTCHTFLLQLFVQDSNWKHCLQTGAPEIITIQPTSSQWVLFTSSSEIPPPAPSTNPLQFVISASSSGIPPTFNLWYACNIFGLV